MPMILAFDRASYPPGSLVSGHVILVRSKSPQKIKGLTLRILGGVQGTDKLFVGKDTYFDEKLDIFGHDGTDSIVGVGETLFPFSFTLPRGLPSSFAWSRGSIVYWVEAYLTRSGWKDDKKVAVRLGVDGIYDLNIDPGAWIPGTGGGSKYLSHLLDKSGPFAFTVATERSGFLKGGTIPFQVVVRNLSKVEAKRVKVSLIQEVTGEDKSWSRVLEGVRGPEVSSGQVESWQGRLKIPGDIPPTNLGNCVTFQVPVTVNYFLKVELRAKCATVDSLSAKVPLIIGTIPLAPRSRGRNHAHEDACPLHSYTPSPGVSPGPIVQSQFSPGLLIQVPNSRAGNQLGPVLPRAHAHSHSHAHNQGIYRRLRELQRRRRESPPPTYDEAVSPEERGQGRGRGQSSNEQSQGTNSSSSILPNGNCQPHKTTPSPSPGERCLFSEEEANNGHLVLGTEPEVTCSKDRDVSESVSSGEESPAPSPSQSSQASSKSLEICNNHVVTVIIGGSGPEVDAEDTIVYQV